MLPVDFYLALVKSIHFKANRLIRPPSVLRGILFFCCFLSIDLSLKRTLMPSLLSLRQITDFRRGRDCSAERLLHSQPACESKTSSLSVRSSSCLECFQNLALFTLTAWPPVALPGLCPVPWMRIFILLECRCLSLSNMFKKPSLKKSIYPFIYKLHLYRWGMAHNFMVRSLHLHGWCTRLLRGHEDQLWVCHHWSCACFLMR